MKKTIFLALVLTAGCAFAETSAEMNKQLVYLQAYHNVTGSDYTLSYTIDSISAGKANSGSLLQLAENYNLKAQTDGNANKAYIGLQNGDSEGDNRLIAHTENNTVNTYTVDSTKVSGDSKPEDRVVGWVTTNATGNNNDIKDFSGSTVTVASTSAGSTISIAMDKQNLTHKVTNTLALNVSDLAFQSNATADKFSYSGLTLNGHTMDESVLTKQEITSTVGAKGYAGRTVFNFAIFPGQSVTTGDVIAAYYDPDQKFGGANYFTLTKEGDNVFFTANMGTWDGTADNLTFSQDSRFGNNRTLTLSDAPLTIGEEYTVVINGANEQQTVYLFDSKQVLKATGTYNGNMNGNLSSGSYTSYTNSAFVAPEPATATLSLLALAALASRRKRH